MKKFLNIVGIFFLTTSLFASDISVENARIRMMPPGSPMTAGYFLITNNSDKDITKEDQLIKILERFPNNDVDLDTSFLRNEEERDYHNQAKKIAQGSTSKTLSEKFNLSNNDLVEILSSMLEYNPKFRPSASQILKNKIFDCIRVQENEAQCLSSKVKV